MARIPTLLLCLLLTLTGCPGGKKGEARPAEETATPVAREVLQCGGTLTAVTLYSSTSYFQYKMQTMGYEYDLIRDFARSEGLKLEVKVARNLGQLVEMVERGEADIAAYPVPANTLLKQQVRYCGHEDISSQVLVQRAGKGDTLLTDVTQLIGKTVYVPAGSKYAERLHNLDDELGGGIRVREMERDSLSAEDLIGMVSTGEIPYTVCDDKTARLNKTYYWNIDIRMKVSFPQRASWIVSRDRPELAEAVDRWASDKAGERTYRAAAKRYFELSKQPMNGDIPEVKAGQLSPYDALFRKHARNIGWDWQLLASISYQESRFNPSLVSWAGAEGLMGIMPNTAKALGVTPHELKEPDAGIRTGVDCLRRFRQGFTKVEDPEEKIKFTLAAYNAGIGHVYDAQRLAEKYGKDPYVWEGNVAEYVRLKSEPEYYNDPVCKHGYLRGSETCNYVEEILQRYRYYKEKTKG